MRKNTDDLEILDPYDKKIKVKRLGQKIGYGNMMSIARELWAEEMKKEGHPISGVFVPVLMADIKPEKRKHYDK